MLSLLNLGKHLGHADVRKSSNPMPLPPPTTKISKHVNKLALSQCAARAARTKANHRSRCRDRLKPRSLKSWPPCLRGTRAVWRGETSGTEEHCSDVGRRNAECLHNELLEGAAVKPLYTLTMNPCGRAIYLRLSALSLDLHDSDDAGDACPGSSAGTRAEF